MAKTSMTIYMDYKKAMDQADRLESAAKRVRTERTRLEQCQKRVSGAWKGESGSQFFRKMSKAGTDLNEVEGVLTNASATIRSIAEETYQAEMTALRLAQERKS